VEATAAGDAAPDVSVRKFTRVYAIVEENYADPVDPDKAIYQGAIPECCGRWTRTLVFDARSFRLLREDQSGHYYGVGCVAPRGDQTIVVAPFVGSPPSRPACGPAT
jgi:C-terminal processing protease CtpA/Prc